VCIYTTTLYATPSRQQRGHCILEEPNKMRAKLFLHSSYSSPLLSSSSSSPSSSCADATFFAGFFFFFLFLLLVPVFLARGRSSIFKTSSSTILLSVLYFDRSSFGGAARICAPFFVKAAKAFVSHGVLQLQSARLCLRISPKIAMSCLC